MDLKESIIMAIIHSIGVLVSWIYHQGKKPFSEIDKKGNNNNTLIGMVTVVFGVIIYFAFR